MSSAPQGPTDRVPARAGQVLRGKWRLDNLIAIGGMSTVYAATHRNGKRGAVKLLHYDLSLNEESRTRFLREGYVANKVDHEGAVSVFDDDICDDGTVYLVMELLEGQTVDTILRARQSRTFGLGETLRLADRLLDVLAAAHDKGVVHRDIKPENLFITDRGNLKVLDFGIARLRESASGAGVTRAGDLLGTPSFMSPEQALGNMDGVDGRSDLWSVGATMFRLLTGRPVHEADTVNRVLLAAMTQPAPPIARVLPAVPAELASLIDRALAFEQGARWPDARSMRAAVRAFAEHGGIRVDGAVLNERDEAKVRPTTVAMDPSGAAPPVSRPDAPTTRQGYASLDPGGHMPPVASAVASAAGAPLPAAPSPSSVYTPGAPGVHLPPVAAPALPPGVPAAPALPALPPGVPAAPALPALPALPSGTPAPERRRAPAAPVPFATSPVPPLSSEPIPIPRPPPPLVAPSPDPAALGLLPDADDDDDDAATQLRDNDSPLDYLPADVRARIQGSAAPALGFGPLPAVRPPSVTPAPRTGAPASAPWSGASPSAVPSSGSSTPSAVPSSAPSSVSPLSPHAPVAAPSVGGSPLAAPASPLPAHHSVPVVAAPSFGAPPLAAPAAPSPAHRSAVAPKVAAPAFEPSAGEPPATSAPTRTAAPTYATPTGERPLASVPGVAPAVPTDTPVSRDTIDLSEHMRMFGPLEPPAGALPRPSVDPDPSPPPPPRPRRTLLYVVFGAVAVLGGVAALVLTGRPPPADPGAASPGAPSAPASASASPGAASPAIAPTASSAPASSASASASVPASSAAPLSSSPASAPATTKPPPPVPKRPPPPAPTKADPFSSRKW